MWGFTPLELSRSCHRFSSSLQTSDTNTVNHKMVHAVLILNELMGVSIVVDEKIIRREDILVNRLTMISHGNIYSSITLSALYFLYILFHEIMCWPLNADTVTFLWDQTLFWNLNCLYLSIHWSNCVHYFYTNTWNSHHWPFSV